MSALTVHTLTNPLEYFQEIAKEGSLFFGRAVKALQEDILPPVAEVVQKLSKELIKDYFFVIPSIAVSLDHFGDAGGALIVSAVSATDLLIKDRDFREFAALFFGAPIAINLGLKAVRFISAPSGYELVSMAIQAACLAKLVLVGKGENY